MAYTWAYNGLIAVYNGLKTVHKWSHNGYKQAYKWTYNGLVMVHKGL